MKNLWLAGVALFMTACASTDAAIRPSQADEVYPANAGVLVLDCGKIAALVLMSPAGEMLVIDRDSGTPAEVVVSIAKELDEYDQLVVISTSCGGTRI